MICSSTPLSLLYPTPNSHSCYQKFPTAPGLPGPPADRHAARMRSTTSWTPFPSLTLVNTVGPSPLISFASRSMTSSDAFTSGAMSICGCPFDHMECGLYHQYGPTLLMTSKSDCEIPGPPFRGILSPPYAYHHHHPASHHLNYIPLRLC